MDKETVKLVAHFYEIYSYICHEARSRDECTAYITDVLKMPKSSSYKFINSLFEGKAPMTVIENEMISLDVWQFREFMEKFGAGIHEDSYKILSGPAPAPKGKNAESEIGKVTTTESPIVQDLNKKLKDAKAKLSRAKKDMAALEEQHQKEMDELRAAMEKELSDVCFRLMDKTSEQILANMDCKVLVTPSIKSVPKEVLAMDFFLDDPAKTLDIPWLLSKYGGQRDSMYEVVDGEDKKLDITTHINKVGRALFKTDIFKRRVADESRLRLVDAGTAREVDMPYIKRRKISGAEIYENRLRTINEILTNPALSNQQKLAFYAGWSEYKGTEFAEYLELAGDMGLDAASVVKLLENPGEHNNYHNVRAFLLQSLKSSEARIKREAVKELICGEWYVEAEYGGKVCRFQMMPVDEIVAFKQAIENLHFDEAIRRAHNLIGVERVALFQDDDATKQLFVERKKTEKEVSIEREQTAIERMHQINEDSGVDVHVPVDVECEDGFESREVANGTGEE